MKKTILLLLSFIMLIALSCKKNDENSIDENPSNQPSKVRIKSEVIDNLDNLNPIENIYYVYNDDKNLIKEFLLINNVTNYSIDFIYEGEKLVKSFSSLSGSLLDTTYYYNDSVINVGETWHSTKYYKDGVIDYIITTQTIISTGEVRHTKQNYTFNESGYVVNTIKTGYLPNINDTIYESYNAKYYEGVRHMYYYNPLGFRNNGIKYFSHNGSPNKIFETDEYGFPLKMYNDSHSWEVRYEYYYDFD